MNLPFLLFLGILNTAYARYKIPDHDNCVLKVLLCDDFIKPLTPVDNSTLEMFQTIGELNAVCDELSRFRICLKDAEIFCKENFRLDLGFELLNIRRLAFDLCVRGSSHQHVYMMVEECVNKYSHSAIQFCTDKAVESVGLNFYLGDYESECRFLGTIQHCHIAVVTDQCGGIAGNMLQKLVVFRGQRDWMCIGYEKKRLKDLEAHQARLDSYVQQYRDLVQVTGAEDKAENIDGLKNLKTPSPEASSQFHARISTIPDEVLIADKNYANSREQLFNLKISQCAENRPLCSCLTDYRPSDSQHTAQNSAQRTRRFYEQPTGKGLSDENCACKITASFLLIGIHPNGEYYQLGYGEADVLWAKFSPLKDISCAWVLNSSEPIHLSRCSILIGKYKVAQKDDKRMQCDLPCNATIAVYETLKERGSKRVAELRMCHFEYSSTLELRLERVIGLFKTHANDVRFLCAEQLKADLNMGPYRAPSTSRVGFIPYEDHKYNMVRRRNKISDLKYHFYVPEQLEYQVDTEIHLISSGDEDHKKESEVDNDSSLYYDKDGYPFLRDAFSENNFDGLTTSLPSPPKSSFHSYRPYDLYRPRMGETLEAEEQYISSKDLRMEDDEESNLDADVFSFEDGIENGYTSHMHSEEMCPVQPENISKLVNKPVRYFRVNYANIADPLDIELKRNEKFSISKEEEDISPSILIWKAEIPERITTTDNKQNQYEEIYVVTPSTEIETSSVPNWIVSEDVQNPDENSQILRLNDGQQNFVEVPQENLDNSKLEKDFIIKTINAENSNVGILEQNSYQSEHPPSDECIDAPTNNEVSSEDEQLSPKSKIFSPRSGQTYEIESEEKLFNAFEILAKIKLNVRRIRKMLRKTEMRKITSMKKTEL